METISAFKLMQNLHGDELNDMIEELVNLQIKLEDAQTQVMKLAVWNGRNHMDKHHSAHMDLVRKRWVKTIWELCNEIELTVIDNSQ